MSAQAGRWTVDEDWAAVRSDAGDRIECAVASGHPAAEAELARRVAAALNAEDELAAARRALSLVYVVDGDGIRCHLPSYIPAAEAAAIRAAVEDGDQ